ncbi:hypothetical protein GYY_03030 [Methanococcus maripaludis X1]|uniref:Uncharacterized protein n=1 Tax=Methanococcus maripaludis X1 TaxID=1053692 RepID=G0H419_METMI|nr:hypothetical protein [Methanococcus maripaludis]AEK19485.1 hypothetical protein GYY_03030 [Methanococcus maripaludis X1]
MKKILLLIIGFLLINSSVAIPTLNEKKDYEYPVFEDRFSLLLYACDFENVNYYEIEVNGILNKYSSNQLSLAYEDPYSINSVEIVYNNGSIKEFKRVDYCYGELSEDELLSACILNGIADSFYDYKRDGAYQYYTILNLDSRFLLDDTDLNELYLTEAYFMWLFEEYENAIYYADFVYVPEDQVYKDSILDYSKLALSFT